MLLMQLKGLNEAIGSRQSSNLCQEQGRHSWSGLSIAIILSSAGLLPESGLHFIKQFSEGKAGPELVLLYWVVFDDFHADDLINNGLVNHAFYQVPVMIAKCRQG